MTAFLSWEYLAPGSSDPDETVSLDRSGAVARLVRKTAGAPAEVGWWSGELEPSALGTANEVAERPWAFDEVRSRPPASGTWWASGEQGRMGLWSDPEALPGDELRAALSSLLSACVDAASTAGCVAQVAAQWTSYDDEPVPNLTVSAVGAEQVSMVLHDPDGTNPAAFTDGDGAIAGFSGAEIWIPAGTSVASMLFGWTPTAAGLEVRMTITDEAGTALETIASVKI